MLTNHSTLPAVTVAALYKLRWQVELFFKWIKQHLRIKTFYGTSENAVRAQIWVAVCVYVLIAILKKELKLPQSLHSILQVLSVTAFEKVPIYELLTRNTLPDPRYSSFKQLSLWGLGATLDGLDAQDRPRALVGDLHLDLAPRVAWQDPLSRQLTCDFVKFFT